MSTIKFKGKCLDTKKWIEGYGVILIESENLATIIHKQGNNISQHTEVYPKTVSQFTGLTDKNGVDIFEGDYLRNPNNEIGEVVWFNCGFSLKCKRKNNSIIFITLDEGFLKNKEVIGNSIDNPELLD